MVSIKSIVCATALCMGALSADLPILAREGVALIVEQAVRYRNDDLSEEDASSIVSKAILDIATQDAAASVISEAIQTVIQAGGNPAPSDVLHLVTDAASAYTTISRGANYASYTGYVKANLPKFNVKSATDDLKAQATPAYSRYGPQLASARSSFEADPAGRAAEKTGATIASQFAHDLGLQLVLPTGKNKNKDL